MEWAKSSWYNYLDSQGTFEWSGMSTNSVVMTSGDETKLFGVLKKRTDCAELQRALAKKWQKEYNTHNWADREKKLILPLQVFGITLIGTALWKCQISAMQWFKKQSTSQKSLGNKLRTENTIMLEYKSMVYPHQQLFVVLVSVFKKTYQCWESIRKRQKGWAECMDHCQRVVTGFDGLWSL